MHDTLNNIRGSEGEIDNNKGISIVLCTYNGKSKLAETLSHILSQKCVYPWELLLIDNASTDGTFEFVIDFLSITNIDYRVLKCPKPGKMNAFWLGINNSKYGYILDCDDDNHLDENYLQKGLEILSCDSFIGALGGKGIPKTNVQLPDWFNRFGASYAVGNQSKKDGRLAKNIYLYGAGCFYNKKPLLLIRDRGFNSILTCRTGKSLSSGGDTELCIVLELLGYQIWYDSSLVFYHEIPDSKLDWEFYLKLKKGISSNYPMLASYKLNGIKSVTQFKILLFVELITVFKGVLKTHLFLFWNNEKSVQASRVVTRTKLKSFFDNYFQTIDSFKKNKKIFKGLI